ncbi:MarR family winged helix-turn-helix transcriptional regulator [Herbidospora mongoliensis]|uniref:MarR family winged helix-turn-helix transcriptional regulator n=1 Tax=Herbidospora mongoliensis TaxID=688067 RepID=UPI0008317389|nr:MarR family transcriptional regulator [Herbidospora mongoliensis]
MREYIGFLLRTLYARFAADGSGPRDYVLLEALADQAAESQQELAKGLGINRTIMVRLIDRLSEEGLVVRTVNPANRRSHVISVTSKGRDVLEGMRAAMAARDSELTAALTPAERDRFTELLARLVGSAGSAEHLVSQAHFMARRRGDALLAGAGMKMRYFGPLWTIGHHGPCPQQRLAEVMGYTEAAAAQVVEELVASGSVARGHDPLDRRRYALELTPTGMERLETAQSAADTLQGEVIAALGGPAEGEEFGELLRRLV